MGLVLLGGGWMHLMECIWTFIAILEQHCPLEKVVHIRYLGDNDSTPEVLQKQS